VLVSNKKGTQLVMLGSEVDGEVGADLHAECRVKQLETMIHSAAGSNCANAIALHLQRGDRFFDTRNAMFRRPLPRLMIRGHGIPQRQQGDVRRIGTGRSEERRVWE